MANTIREQYVIKLLANWIEPEEVDIANLPDKFVLKNNHDSGVAVIYEDKKYEHTLYEQLKTQRKKT